MAGVRLVLDVVVTPGTRQGSKTSQAPLWDLLGRLGREHWPRLVRGDKDWGYPGYLTPGMTCSRYFDLVLSEDIAAVR